MEDMKTDL